MHDSDATRFAGPHPAARAPTLPATPAFAVPPGARTAAWARAAALAVATLLVMLMPEFADGSFDVVYASFWLGVALGTFAVFAAAAAVRTGGRYYLDDVGLTRIDPLGAPTRIRWSEVTRVRERPILRRLEIAAGRRVIRVPLAVEDYPDLAASVAGAVDPAIVERRNERRTDTAAVAASEQVFSRSWLAVLPLAIVGPAALVLSLALFGGVLFVAAIIFGGCLFSWLTGWQYVRLGAGTVRIEYPLRTRRIPIGDVVRVDFGRRSQPGEDPSFVDVWLADGDVFRLGRCREGTLALYTALTRGRERDAALARLAEEDA